ncbi:unnamed protein product [Urochloa humidicola]
MVMEQSGSVDEQWLYDPATDAGDPLGVADAPPRRHAPCSPQPATLCVGPPLPVALRALRVVCNRPPIAHRPPRAPARPLLHHRRRLSPSPATPRSAASPRRRRLSSARSAQVLARRGEQGPPPAARGKVPGRRRAEEMEAQGAR